MSAILKDNDVANAIKGMDGWQYDDVYRCLRKEFAFDSFESAATFVQHVAKIASEVGHYPEILICLLYTSPSPRDRQKSRMPSSA